MLKIVCTRSKPAIIRLTMGERPCVVAAFSGGIGDAPSRALAAFRAGSDHCWRPFIVSLEGAVAQGLTTASRGSLDGTLIAAHASRHRLVNLSRLRRPLEELDRVIAADKTRQDLGPIPG